MYIKNKLDLAQIIGCIAIILTFLLTGVLFLIKFAHMIFLLRLGFLLVGAVVGYIACFRKKKTRSILFFPFAFAYSWVCCYLSQGKPNCSAVDMLYTLFYVGIAVAMLYNVKYMKNISLGMAVMTMLYILYKLFIGVPFIHILTATSQNYISVLILFFLLLYYTSCHEANEGFFVFPSYMFFVCCLLVRGRSGIVLSAAFAIAVTVFKINMVEKKMYRNLLKVAIVRMLAVAAWYLFTIIKERKGDLNGTALARFTNKGTIDAERLIIWKAFFTNNLRSVSTFLWGSDTSLIREDGNLHNSFFMCYAKYGLFMFVTMLSLIAYSLILALKNKQYFMLLLFSTLLLRAFTDLIFYQGYCEMFLYYFVFYFILNNRKERRKTKDANNRLMLCLYNTISNN